jgi:hypothetical protein
VFRRLKISLKVNDFFSKGDQLDFPKMGRMIFLIRWFNLIGFSCIWEKVLYSEIKFGKMGYQARGHQKIRQI